MKKTAVLALFCVSIIIGSAADSLQLDLDGAVELGLRNNAALKIAQKEYEEAERSLKSVWNNFLPSLDMSSGFSARKEVFNESQSISSVNPWDWDTSLSASLSFNADVIASIKQTRLDYEKAQINYTSAKNGLIRNIKKLFYYIITLKENVSLKEDNMELARKRYVQTQSKYDNGLASELELLSSQVSYENQKPGYTQAKLDYQTELLNLKKLLGAGDATDIEPDGTLDVVFYTFDPGADIEQWLDQVPDLKLKQIEINRLEWAKSAAAGSNMTPTLTLRGGLDSSLNDPFNRESWQNHNWSNYVTFGITLSLHLDAYIPRSERFMRVLDAKGAVEKAQIEYDELKLNTLNSVRKLLLQLESYREKMNLSELSTELARQTYQMAEESYNNGLSELLDVENVQQELLTAQQNYITAQYQYLAGLIDLESTLNKPLSEIAKEQNDE